MRKRYQQSPPSAKQHSKKQYGYREHSRSRSRKKHKSKSKRDYERERSYHDYPPIGRIPIKAQSDIKNHFKFEIPHLSRQQEQKMISILKNQLIQDVGPVEHISVAKQNRQDNKLVLNVGFRYDIDALSYYQTGSLAIKTETQDIKTNPKPTKIFQLYISDTIENQQMRKNRQFLDEEKQERKRKRSPSKISSPEKSLQREHPSSYWKIQELAKVLVFGVPSYLHERRVLGMVNEYMGTDYFCTNYCWRRIKNSCCEYFEFHIEESKASKIVATAPKMVIDNYPIIAIEDPESVSQALTEYQFTIQFPKKVEPYYVLKGINNLSRVVQITSLQQIQQEGKCKSYAVTINDKKIAHQLRKVGRLESGIIVESIKFKQYVYRPMQSILLPL